MSPWLRRTFPLLVCAPLLMAAGCGGGGGTGGGADPTVYFINASADAGIIDYFLNGVLQQGALDYLDSSADFQTIPFVGDTDGGYDVVAKDNGTGTDLDAQNVVFGQNDHHAVIGLGLRNFVPGEELKRFRTLFLVVDRKAPNGNKARLYIVHAFVREVGQATPDIKFQNPGDNPQFATGGIAFGEMTTLVVDSGTMDWVAKRDDATGNVVYASATTTLDPSSVYVVLVSGIENDPDPNKLPKITFLKLSTT